MERKRDNSFIDKVAVVTGGAHGIGKAMTKLMIYHGEHGWEYRI